MQPSSQPWLFALDVAQTDQTDTRLMSDFHLQRRQPVEATSVLPSQFLATGAARVQHRSAHALAQPAVADARQSARASAGRRVAPGPCATAGAGRGPVAALQPRALRLHLKPPATGADRVDDFLFDTRSSAAHYAGAMAFVTARRGHSCASGGRLPGRRAESGGQLPAGASVRRPRLGRVLAAGAGLAERRPDLQVAPERIEQGLEQALAGDSEYLADAPLSPLRYRGLPWLNDMRLAWDSLNYGCSNAGSWPTRVSSRAPSCSAGSAGSIRPDWACCSVPRRYCQSVCSRCSCSSPGKAVTICAAANCAASNACWRCMACAVPRRRATLLRRARRPRPAGAGASHRGLRRRVRSATLWTRRCR